MTTTLLRQGSSHETISELPQARLHGPSRSLVSVVIPCYNQGRFLSEAIETVLQQTYRNFEILVVDDGSTDDTAAVAQSYPVRYIYQKNGGLPAARNTGIRASRGEFVVLLDSDDRLFPHAIESGVQMLLAHSHCMMASGDFSFVSADGSWIRPSGKPLVTENHYQSLLRSNFIEMTATCLFRREVFDRVGLFDPSLRASEDYEFYLRVARDSEIVCHSATIAEYRSHGNSMSRDGERMLNETMRVVHLQEKNLGSDPDSRQAYNQGIKSWRRLYGRHLAVQLALQPKTRAEGYGRKLKLLARQYPPGLLIHLLCRLMPDAWNRILEQRKLRRLGWVPPGQVNWGNIRNLVPIGKLLDVPRGTSIHAFYCQKALSACRAVVKEPMLYIGEPQTESSRQTMTALLGADNLAMLQTVTVEEFQSKHWGASQFNCILISDCLEYLPDPAPLLALAKQLLNPNGVLLAILPGLQSGHRQCGVKNLHWRFTTHSASNLFEQQFGREQLQIASYGNVLTTVAALHGLAAEELKPQELEPQDPAYEVTIFVRAVNA
jgi:glycosyltransferase involved in cell wall biosynthesis